MTELLLRLFVKNHSNTKDAAVHTAIGKLAGTMGILCNILLFALKLVAGLLSGAVSVVADALNNLSDAASSVVTLLGFRLAQRPADKDHPFGHARYEYLSGVIVAALILLIGAELAKTSIEKILHPEPIDFSWITAVILLCSVSIKLWMMLFYRKLSKHIASTTLKAASVDSRNDVITSVAVLFGLTVGWMLQINIDGYVGLVVAAFILYSGIGVAKETISPLLGERADRQLVQQIHDLVLDEQKVLGVHDLLVHDYGPGRCYASVHVELSAEEDPLVCHDIIDRIECSALERLNVHLVIHYDPVVLNDTEWDKMRREVELIAAGIDHRLSIHDFRLVRGASQTKLVFDLSVPYDLCQRRIALKEQIDAELQSKNGNYMTVIRFDEE